MTRHTRLPSTQTGRQPSRRRAATRQRLLDGARRMFAEHGVNGATVEDICEAAGFTRGAFYSNFATKEDLVVALMALEDEQIVAALARAVEKRQRRRDPEFDLGGIVDLFVAGQPVDREHALMQAELRLYAIRNPEVADQLNTGRDAFRDQLGTLLETGMGRAGRRLTVPTADAVLMLLGVAEAGLRDELTQAPEEWEGLPGLAVLLLTLVEAVSVPMGTGGNLDG